MHLQGGVRLPVVAGVDFAVQAGRMRRARRALRRRQDLDPEDDLRQLSLRPRPHPASGTAATRSTSPPRSRAQSSALRRHTHRLCQPVPARRAARGGDRRGRRAAGDRTASRARRRGRRRRRAAVAGSTCRSGSGRCRRRPSRAASSSASTSRAASCPICRSCCSTSRPPRSTPATARWWST